MKESGGERDLGLAPDSAKAMEREGVGRVILANLCFSDQDRSSVAVFQHQLIRLLRQDKLRRVSNNNNNQIVQHALQQFAEGSWKGKRK